MSLRDVFDFSEGGVIDPQNLALVVQRRDEKLITPDQPRRCMSHVLERIARAICAIHNDCKTTDGYTDKRWPSFLPGAKAAYDELLRIDEERSTHQSKDTTHDR